MEIALPEMHNITVFTLLVQLARDRQNSIDRLHMSHVLAVTTVTPGNHRALILTALL